MSVVMDAAKITSKGQVTIPADVRKAVGVHEGDKLLFVRMDDGSITLRNSNLETIREGQHAFAGAAEEAGIRTQEDVVDLIKNIRAERATPKSKSTR